MVPNCPEPHHLEQLLLGRLHGAEAEALELHLTSCPHCANELEKRACVDPLVEAMRAAREEGETSPERLRLLIRQFQRLRGSQYPGPERQRRDSAAGAPGLNQQDTVTVIGQSTAPPEQPFAGFLAPARADDELGWMGPYRVRQVLGHGGMGVVFLAEDLRLKRQVALKVIKPELLPSAVMRQRFRQEAESVAAVEHENIVAIHEVNEERGVPYLVMPLLRGQSLEERLRQVEGTLPVEEVMRIGRQIAEGLAAAHDCGLIHRDIKPANVFLCAAEGPGASPGRKSGESRVKILDFGLAQALGEEERVPGAVVGTPAYMAPEQAAGQPLDGRADLFSLGCVLYRLATGRPAFEGRNVCTLLIRIALDEPAPPARVCPTVPVELSELIVRLLAKKPEERPATAHEVVEVLTRFEQERSRRGLSRRGWLVVAGSVLGAAGLGAWVVGALRGPPAPGEVTLELDEPPARLLLLGGEQPKELTLDRRLTLTLPPGSYELRLADKEALRVPFPDSFVVESGQSVTVPLRLVGEIRRQVEHSGLVWAVAFTPCRGEAWVLSAGDDGSVGVWNAAGQEKPQFFTRQDQETVVPVRAVAFAPDGQLAASAGGKRSRKNDPSICLWEVQTRRQVERLVGHQGWVNALAFTADGARLASGEAEGVACIWEVQTGKCLHTLKGHDELGVNGVAWTLDGKHLLTAGGDGQVIVWDAASGEKLPALEGRKDVAMRSVAVVGNDLAVTAADDGSIQLWDLKSRTARALKGHTREARQAVFLPDGKRVLSGGADGFVRLWDVASGQEVYRFAGHRGTVHGVACAGDGRRAVSCGQDGTVRFWELPR